MPRTVELTIPASEILVGDTLVHPDRQGEVRETSMGRMYHTVEGATPSGKPWRVQFLPHEGVTVRRDVPTLLEDVETFLGYAKHQVEYTTNQLKIKLGHLSGDMAREKARLEKTPDRQPNGAGLVQQMGSQIDMLVARLNTEQETVKWLESIVSAHKTEH